MNAIRAADLQNDPQISNEIKESQRTKLKPFTKHFNDFDQYKRSVKFLVFINCDI